MNQPGPLALWSQHLRNVADQLERYHPLPQPIPIVWHDQNYALTFSEPEDTRKALLRQYFALCNKAGITDKDAQLELIQDVLGQHTERTEPVRSRAELTVPELGRLCQALTDWERVEGYAS